MITFLWSFFVAFGFAMAGFLLREGEFRLSVILFFVTWAWFLFPKAPMWLIRQAGRLFHGRRKVVV